MLKIPEKIFLKSIFIYTKKALSEFKHIDSGKKNICVLQYGFNKNYVNIY